MKKKLEVKHILLIQLINSTIFKLTYIIKILWNYFVENFSFINKYVSRNELMWSDGFLLDFLQKKTADLWVRKFLIYTGFLFSERLVFEYIIRMYTDYLILPTTRYFYLELPNVSSVLSITLFIYNFVFIFFFAALLSIII